MPQQNNTPQKNSAQLVFVAAALAAAIAKDMSADDTALLAAFLTTVADNLALIAAVEGTI